MTPSKAPRRSDGRVHVLLRAPLDFLLTLPDHENCHDIFTKPVTCTSLHGKQQRARCLCMSQACFGIALRCAALLLVQGMTAQL